MPYSKVFYTFASKYEILMGKKIMLFAMMLIMVASQAHAVLKERDITRTLAILRQELTNSYTDLEMQSGFMKEQQATVRAHVMSVLNQSQQNALMLYSQRSGNIFDLTYACHEATEQYRKFKADAGPFKTYIDEANIEVNRYDSLITDLGNMYVASLSPKAQIDRNVCLTLAVNIRRTLNENRTQMEQYVKMYDYAENQLKSLNDYANKRYAGIQHTIFGNGGEDYLSILTSLPRQFNETSKTVREKYRPLKHANSDWDSRVILGLFIVLFVGGAIAAVLNWFFIGFLFTWLTHHHRLDAFFAWISKKREGIDAKESFEAKRVYIIMMTSVLTFAIILGVVRMLWQQNFIIMASGLLVEYAWLIGVILLSLLIRLDGVQIMRGFRIYAPIMAICLIVITFRIILIPSDLVNLIFPPILLVCALWQWQAIARHNKHVPRSDKLYTYVSLAIFVTSVIASMVGYTLLAVEMLIWWTMQMACILTITCISSMLRRYGNNPARRYFDTKTPITQTWLFRLVYSMVLPTLGAMSVIFSIYWAADVFNLSDTSIHYFTVKLVDSKNFTFSLFAAVQVVILYFFFAYLNQTSVALLYHQFTLNEQEAAERDNRKADQQNVVSRASMWKNVLQVIVWGTWVLISMNIFNINNTWLVAISAGLSTGIGFAMKDIIENIYYGISLMAGRIRVGDFIAIDGTRGTVRNISYTSTMIEAGDGSVIAYQNSQLFTLNYKNLTKNHGNELASIPVGVAYGTKVPEVKQLIADAITAIERKDYIRYLNTVFDGLGDNSINFKVFVWVDSRRMSYAKSEILEAIYNVLNEHHIEIPYPQHDLHIVSDTTRQVKFYSSEEEAFNDHNNGKS